MGMAIELVPRKAFTPPRPALSAVEGLDTICQGLGSWGVCSTTSYCEKCSSRAVSSEALGSKVAGMRSAARDWPSSLTRQYRKTGSAPYPARPPNSPLKARVTVTGARKA